ncbi:hypothetical protein VP01_3561g3 [Puccinia sorghi]|uniref:Uncharacterized protein n=1 Tax=Puccinia sorghi TaxID=27349 RepID=A0A0L6UVB6_9BASI|nr:hypothetical protein VP01_3561g3 [Puccinia sorghi]
MRRAAARLDGDPPRLGGDGANGKSRASDGNGSSRPPAGFSGSSTSIAPDSLVLAWSGFSLYYSLRALTSCHRYQLLLLLTEKYQIGNRELSPRVTTPTSEMWWPVSCGGQFWEELELPMVINRRNNIIELSTLTFLLTQPLHFKSPHLKKLCSNSLFEDKFRGKIPNQFQEVSQVRLEFCFLCYASQLNSVVHSLLKCLRLDQSRIFSSAKPSIFPFCWMRFLSVIDASMMCFKQRTLKLALSPIGDQASTYMWLECGSLLTHTFYFHPSCEYPHSNRIGLKECHNLCFKKKSQLAGCPVSFIFFPITHYSHRSKSKNTTTQGIQMSIESQSQCIFIEELNEETYGKRPLKLGLEGVEYCVLRLRTKDEKKGRERRRNSWLVKIKGEADVSLSNPRNLAGWIVGREWIQVESFLVSSSSIGSFRTSSTRPSRKRISRRLRTSAVIDGWWRGWGRGRGKSMSGGRARIEGQSKGPVDQISMDLNVLEVRGRAIRDKWEGWEGSTANSVASVHSGCFSGLNNHLSRCATRRTLGDSGVCRRDVGKPHFQRAGTTGIQEYFVSQSIASQKKGQIGKQQPTWGFEPFYSGVYRDDEHKYSLKCGGGKLGGGGTGDLIYLFSLVWGADWEPRWRKKGNTFVAAVRDATSWQLPFDSYAEPNNAERRHQSSLRLVCRTTYAGALSSRWCSTRSYNYLQQDSSAPLITPERIIHHPPQEPFLNRLFSSHHSPRRLLLSLSLVVEHKVARLSTHPKAVLR